MSLIGTISSRRCFDNSSFVQFCQSSRPVETSWWSAICLHAVVADLFVRSVRVSAERLGRLWRPARPRLGNRQPFPSYCQASRIRHSDECPCASGSFVSTSAVA